MTTKWIAALAAASLAAAPAAAAQTTSRTAAPIGDSEELAGGVGVVWIAALAVAIGAIIILSDDDDNEEPVSP